MKQFQFKILFTIALIVGLSGIAMAKSAKALDEDANRALTQFYHDVRGSKAFLSKVKGYLVFPTVTKAGFIFGGEYGEGVLRINGKTKYYYSLTSGSVGFQAGIQQNAIIIAFITERSLRSFLKSDGWEAGIDGSIAIAEWGMGKDLSSISFEKPIVGFVFDSRGLMGSLSIEGTKFQKIIP